MTVLKPKTAKDRIILALDVDTVEEAKELVLELRDYVGFFKIGLQLQSCGYEACEAVKSLGGKVFYDMKFHDIPNTVARASANLVKRGIDFFDLHIKGGSKMMSATVRLANETAKKYGMESPSILGVTLLSSFGQKTLTQELNVNMSIDEYVSRLAATARDSGLAGVVASASEAPVIREECGEDFIIVCPAVRPTWSVVNDQVRVVTPSEAVRAGVDYIVVGRPVTNAQNKTEAIELITQEISDALSVSNDIINV
ncbi:MAG: orotidine-5'-phosphate decarboxylase [Candidatus Gastranaerophilales bacterium]|nr:orotidine-5'-phosphate decarboxylase [Candidatus Gastranaerophilales bacterium]